MPVPVPTVRLHLPVRPVLVPPVPKFGYCTGRNNLGVFFGRHHIETIMKNYKKMKTHQNWSVEAFSRVLVSCIAMYVKKSCSGTHPFIQERCRAKPATALINLNTDFDGPSKPSWGFLGLPVPFLGVPGPFLGLPEPFWAGQGCPEIIPGGHVGALRGESRAFYNGKMAFYNVKHTAIFAEAKYRRNKALAYTRAPFSIYDA